MRSVCALCSKAHLASRPAPDEAVPLQSLVILNVLLELTQRVSGRGALGPSHERHVGKLISVGAVGRLKEHHLMKCSNVIDGALGGGGC